MRLLAHVALAHMHTHASFFHGCCRSLSGKKKLDGQKITELPAQIFDEHGDLTHLCVNLHHPP